MNERVRSNSQGHPVHSNEGGVGPYQGEKPRILLMRRDISLLKSGAKQMQHQKRVGSSNRPDPNSNSRAFARWHFKPTTPITTTDCGRSDEDSRAFLVFEELGFFEPSALLLRVRPSVREKCNGFSQGAGDTRARRRRREREEEELP